MSELIFNPKACYTPDTVRIDIPEISDCDIDFVPNIELDTASRYFSLPPAVLPRRIRRSLDRVKIPPCCDCDDFRWEIEPTAAKLVGSDWVIIDTVYPSLSFRIAAKYSLGAGVTLVNPPTWEILDDEGLDNTNDISLGTPVHSAPITYVDVTMSGEFSNQSIKVKLTAEIEKQNEVNTCETEIQLSVASSLLGRVVSPGENINTVKVQFLGESDVVGTPFDAAKPTELQGFQGSYQIGDEVVLTYSKFAHGINAEWVASDKSIGYRASPETMIQPVGVSGNTPASTVTWVRSDQKDANEKRGLDLRMITRMDFDISEGKIYVYQRTLHFDSLGHLSNVTVETRYEISLLDCDDITS